jgi:hypothetical protein
MLHVCGRFVLTGVIITPCCCAPMSWPPKQVAISVLSLLLERSAIQGGMSAARWKAKFDRHLRR